MSPFRAGAILFLVAAVAAGFRAELQAAPPHPAKGADSAISDSSGEMELATYLTELDRVATGVAHLEMSPAGIESLRRSLPKVWQVRMAGQRFEVPVGWLDSALDTMEKNPVVRDSLQKDVIQQLQALKQEAEALARIGPGQQFTRAHARLASILSRREFRAIHGPTWWDRLRERIWFWIDRILQKVFGRMRGTFPARGFLVWLAIVLTFFLLAYWVRRSLLGGVRADGLRLEGVLPAGKTWRDWAQEALAAAALANYRVAVHAAYWAGVYRLAELGAWQLDRSRTPREYLRLLKEGAPGEQVASRAARPGAAASGQPAERTVALARLTRSLETIWYGYRPAASGDFRDAVAQLEVLGCRFPSNLATADS